MWISAQWSVKYLTMSNRPSKHAARKGVEFVFVGWFTLAPLFTKVFTTFRWPAPGNTEYINTVQYEIGMIVNHRTTKQVSNSTENVTTHAMMLLYAANQGLVHTLLNIKIQMVKLRESHKMLVTIQFRNCYHSVSFPKYWRPYLYHVVMNCSLLLRADHKLCSGNTWNYERWIKWEVLGITQ
jgi:hypothetical protein